MVSTLAQVALWVSLLVALGMLGLYAWRKLRPSALAMSIVALLAALSSRSEAAVIERDHGTYVLAAGDTLDNDLIVTAEIVRIEGTVRGDLMAALSPIGQAIRGRPASDRGPPARPGG